MRGDLVTPMDRRLWLRHTGLGVLLPASLPRSTSAGPKAAGDFPGFGKAKTVLLLYLSGGQSHLDTFDPKPEAPVEVRGEFRSITTSTPGTRVCEHLPRLARLADRYTILRSVSHDDLDHGSAGYWALTGQPHPHKTSNPPPRPTDYPTYGAIVRRVRPGGRLPFAAIHLNGPALVPEDVGPGQYAGFLGTGCEPLVISDPSEESALTLLKPRPDLSPVREARRCSLRQALEKSSAGPHD